MDKRNRGTKETEKKSSGTSLIKQLSPVLFVVLLLGIFILHLTVFSDLEQILQTEDREQFLHLLRVRCLKTAVLVFLLFSLLVLINKVLSGRFLKPALSLLLWLLIFFYSGEIWMSILPPSQGNGEAYVSKIWFKKYWRTNKYGFRDRDYRLDSLKDLKTILYLGDSYVAGHGIRNPEDRTPDILERKSGGAYFVINTGKNGIGTKMELLILKTYPYIPEYVILSHVSNDIEEILPAEDKGSSIYMNTESSLSVFLYENSRNSILGDMTYHLIKTLLWGMAQSPESNVAPEAKTNLYQWYQEDSIFNIHMQDIRDIAGYVTDSLGSRLIIVAYPESGDELIDSSDVYINRKIQRNLADMPGVEFLNATSILKEVPASERNVNVLDGHPGRKVNERIADSLYRLLQAKRPD